MSGRPQGSTAPERCDRLRGAGEHARREALAARRFPGSTTVKIPRPLRSPWVPLVLALALLGWIASGRPTARELRGDEGTYVAMAESLARDADLVFDARDRARIEAAADPTRALILQRSGDRVAYSKPILYALLAAPFARVAPLWGAIVVNALALLAGYLFLRALLARNLGPGPGAWSAATLAGAGGAAAWAGWRMTEALQLGLAAAGVALACGALRPAAADAPGGRLARWLESPRAPWVGGALLGLLVSLREPNALVALAAVAAALAAGRRRAALAIGAAAGAAYLLIVASTAAATGAANPYKAPRSTFNAEVGWPAGGGAERALARFERSDDLATSMLGAVPRLEPARSAYATLYFFVGRHTGLLLYFPGALALLAAALARRDRVGWAALGGFAALALFYLVWLPRNYFGGETFFGNRYILAALPLAALALAAPPPRRLLAAAWALAFAAGASAQTSVATTARFDQTSQSHAYAGLFRLFPYESTASNLDGRRDRYWSGDFLRFVDPYARAEEWSFQVGTGVAPAEVEIATSWEGDPLRLVVATDGGAATLVVSDWLGSERYPLAEHPSGPAGGPVTLRPAPAWRIHPFWWPADRPYRARLLRFSIESPDARPVTARVRYLGRHEAPSDGFGREVLLALPPTRALAGGASLVPVRLRNTGAFEWTSAAVLPVQLGYRFAPEGGAPGLRSQGRTPLPRPVAPGGELNTTMRIDWPGAPGRYELTIDLVLEDVAWFSEKLGAPVATSVVEVQPPG